MTTVKITNLSKTNYTIYNGKFSGQTLFIIYEDEKLYARYGLESAPESLAIINDNAFVWEVNSLLTIQSVNQLMNDILPYVQALAEMATTEWDGVEWVGTFSDEEKANVLLDKIDEFIAVDNEELPHYNIVTPEYYSIIFNNKTPNDMRSYVSSKTYLDDNILFAQDPYDFVNFAIGMNASTADEYIGAIHNCFEMYLNNLSHIDDIAYNNDTNATMLNNAYNDAIDYYFDVIAEPDKIKYADMLTYGNEFFNLFINIMTNDDLLHFEDVISECRNYIVEPPTSTMNEPETDEFDDMGEGEELDDGEFDDESGISDVPGSALSAPAEGGSIVDGMNPAQEEENSNFGMSNGDYINSKSGNAFEDAMAAQRDEGSEESEESGESDENDENEDFWKKENGAKAV